MRRPVLTGGSLVTLTLVAEVMVRDGSWTFDGETVRVVPGHDRRVNKLRQALGQLTVPLQAIAGVAYEPGRKGGRLRLRLRDGADPFLQAVGGQLGDDPDPYRLLIDRENAAVAEYFADELRNSLLLERVPSGPADRYLMPGPGIPLSASAGDGTVSFDGETIRLEWNDWAEDIKKSAGPRQIMLSDVDAVEWAPLINFTSGYLRFRVRGGASGLQPKHDPNCITWGIRREGGTSSLVAAAVIARLPHPVGGKTTAEPSPAPAPALTAEAGGDHDALLRRLRELGDLHHDGVLTDEEFAAAKQAVLRRF